MVTISSTSSAVQSGLQQLRLQQAQRTAEQLEFRAEALRAQAQAAQRTADRAQENARSLTVESDQAEEAAGKARLGLASINSANNAIASLTYAADTVIKTSNEAYASSDANTSSVINTQGQLTGTLINTTA
jgi:hypothetical protein